MKERRKRIINIVDDAGMVNFGIWHSAVSSAGVFEEYDISTELWYPKRSSPDINLPVDLIALESTSLSYLRGLLTRRDLNSGKDVIVTHGCWRFCTRWGNELSQKGFDWIYTPHGMLDPWALRQKAVRKMLYFHFFEKAMAKRARAIRAVSSNEAHHLAKLFPGSRISVVPNGVGGVGRISSNNSNKKRYLFLGRIHKKKGIAELIKGWQLSILNNSSRFELIVAGPDDGELANIQSLLKQSSNISYIGPVYGENKRTVFSNSEFYILPSFSEGFPATVLEAMSYGLICLISGGCNLPEAFQQNIAFEVRPKPESIAIALNQSVDLTIGNMADISQKARSFVKKNYSIKKISEDLLQLYRAPV